MDKKELLARLQKQNISKEIIEAIAKVKRENFIPEEYKKHAYEDIALPLEGGATISQPSTIAFMLSLLELKKRHKVLEIGSGSGYVLALIENITRSETYGVEIIKSLAEKSQVILRNNNNIKVINKSGSGGLPEYAPYDRILMSASAKDIPKQLAKQLNNDGIIVASVRNSIFRLKKEKNTIKTEEYPGFVFVPLVE